MRILHTSDWHLGRSLYGRKRYEEFSSFLKWLTKTIEESAIDILLVAGDIFDTSTPSNRASSLYYEFLSQISKSCCRHVVVIGGNHDSPTFLNAPKDLLKFLNVHVVGAISESIEDELIVLKGEDDQVEAIICAVPYLRDRDIRSVEAGESIDDKSQKLADGVKKHYAIVCEKAEKMRSDYLDKAEQKNIPIIGMGHLFAAGGQTIEGDGVRELYVGSLAYVGVESFPDCIDYMALGHLHVPQMAGGLENIRYSGSPIAMGFGEARQEKSIVCVEFGDEGKTKPSRILIHKVPKFQDLEQIKGNVEEICKRVLELKIEDKNTWLEIEYTGNEIIGSLRESIELALEGSQLEVLRIKNKRIIEKALQQNEVDKNLEDLSTVDVFLSCLESYDVVEAEKPELLACYEEVLLSIEESDQNDE